MRQDLYGKIRRRYVVSPPARSSLDFTGYAIDVQALAGAHASAGDRRSLGRGAVFHRLALNPQAFGPTNLSFHPNFRILPNPVVSCKAGFTCPQNFRQARIRYNLRDAFPGRRHEHAIRQSGGPPRRETAGLDRHVDRRDLFLTAISPSAVFARRIAPRSRPVRFVLRGGRPGIVHGLASRLGGGKRLGRGLREARRCCQRPRSGGGAGDNAGSLADLRG